MASETVSTASVGTSTPIRPSFSAQSTALTVELFVTKTNGCWTMSEKKSRSPGIGSSPR